MKTALDKLRGMAEAARRDSLIATAEADILDRLARVAEDEDDERIDGALEELSDNLRRALDRCVVIDDGDADDDLPSTGCHTCATATSALVEIRDAAVLLGADAIDMMTPESEAAEVVALLRRLGAERDEARAEVEFLRAEVESLRWVDDDDDGAPDTDEPDDGWEPSARWEHMHGSDRKIVYRHGVRAAHVYESKGHWSGRAWAPNGDLAGLRHSFDDARAAMRWCEEMIAAYNSAPAVGAPDAGPDAPALIVEGDDGTGAREARAVPAAPVSGAEQSCGETGVDRPRDDERIVGPREGQTVTSRNPPYGYDVDDSGAVPVLRTVQSEAAVMLRICELLDRRANAPAIAAALNDEGHTSRTGTAWTPSSVRARILGSVDEWRGVV